MVQIITPGDLGFDRNKFPEFRSGQLETSQEASHSKKPLFTVEAPTGVGKSLMGMSTHKLMGGPRTAYLVSTKQLQDQVERDFHIPTLKGRSNYPCLHFPKLFPEVTSEICKDYLGDDDCSFASDCPYMKQKRTALASPACVLNYPLFLTEANYVGGFSKMGLLILDEVDTVEDHLMKFIEITIPGYLIQRLSLGSPKHKTKVDAWKEWGGEVSSKIKASLGRMGDPKGMDPPHLRAFSRLRKSLRKVEYLVEKTGGDWVMEEGKDKRGGGISFKPVKVDCYSQDYLWRHTTFSLGLSATIMGAQAMAIDLGLHSWDVEGVSMPSPFPVESRLVNYIPVANLTHKTKESSYPKVAKAIEAILEKHQKEKVLIHAVSYDLRNFIVDCIRPNSHKLMTHDRESRVKVLEEFKAFSGPAALVSPSMERGVDLPGDLCRVIIVAKVPYPNLVDPQVSKRLHGFSDGSLWYARRTARSLVQMTGRATRFLGDWSTSYILDEQFGQLVGRNGGIFPGWWRESVKDGLGSL